MTISRIINGETVSIELTWVEINQAYHEQLIKFDISDIEEFITDDGELFQDLYHPEFVTYLLQNKELIAQWASEYRELLDFGWSRNTAWEHMSDYMRDERTVWLKDHPEFILDDEEIKL